LTIVDGGFLREYIRSLQRDPVPGAECFQARTLARIK
jgi:hypothetical protein